MYWKSKTWLQQPLSLPSGALQRSGGSQSQLDVTDSLQPRWTQAAFMQLRFIPSQHSLCCANPTLFHPHDQLSPSYCPSSAPFPFPLPSWCPTHPSYKVSEGYTGRGEAEAWGAVILQGRIVIANKKKTNIGEQRVKNAVPSKHGSEDEAPSYSLQLPSWLHWQWQGLTSAWQCQLKKDSSFVSDTSELSREIRDGLTAH